MLTHYVDNILGARSERIPRVTRTDGTGLGSITRDGTGATTGFTWSFPSQNSVSDADVRSQTGRHPYRTR